MERPARAARWVVGLQPVEGIVIVRSIGEVDDEGEGVADVGVVDGLGDDPLAPAWLLDGKLVSLLCAFRSMAWPMKPPMRPARTANTTPYRMRSGHAVHFRERGFDGGGASVYCTWYSCFCCSIESAGDWSEAGDRSEAG